MQMLLCKFLWTENNCFQKAYRILTVYIVNVIDCTEHLSIRSVRAKFFFSTLFRCRAPPSCTLIGYLFTLTNNWPIRITYGWVLANYRAAGGILRNMGVRKYRAVEIFFFFNSTSTPAVSRWVLWRKRPLASWKVNDVYPIDRDCSVV